MIEKIAATIQDVYIRRRHEDGTATEYSWSDKFFKPVREKGLIGIVIGIKESKDALGIEKTVFTPTEQEIIYWGAMGIGAAQFILILSGFKGRTTGNWDWFRKFIEQNFV